MLGRARDALYTVGAAALLVLGLVVIALGGYALYGVTGRYGLPGTLISIFLLALWCMFAVPFVMGARALRHRGSARYRRAYAQRNAAHAERYGLVARPDDDR